MEKEHDRQSALESEVMSQHDKNTAYHVYCENDAFTMGGAPVFTVLDFWRFQYCQLKNQQDSIAEYLVSRALGITKAENISFWTGYDLSYRAKRIEVKATSYVHTWNKRKVSNVRTFSIAPSNNYYWYGKPDENGKKAARQNEAYIFCLNSNRDIENADPLVVDYWDFYVVPTFVINEMCEKNGNPGQKTVSLGVVKRLAKEPVNWTQLREKVDDAIDRVDQHFKGMNG